MASPDPATKTCQFTDIVKGSYYYKAVIWATETGITEGTSATDFNPERLCSRAEIVTSSGDSWANGLNIAATHLAPLKYGKKKHT